MHSSPVKVFTSLINRFSRKRTRHVPLHPLTWPTKQCLPLRCIHANDVKPINAKLLRRLINDRGKHCDSLDTTRRTLRCTRRRIGIHRQAAQPHMVWLIHEGCLISSRHKVTGPCIRTTVLNVKQVNRHDGSVALKPKLRSSLNPRTCAAKVVFFLAGHPKLDWLSSFSRKQCWNTSLYRSGNLAAESTTTVLTDQHEVFRVHANPTRHTTFGPRGTLRGTVHVAFAVLPVSHRCSCFKRLV